MKKVVILSLMSILGLALLGLCFAHWSKTLAVSGTVNTGKVDWELTSFAILDKYAPPPYKPTSTPDYNSGDGFIGDFWEVDKNVGWGKGKLVDTDGDGDKDTLILNFRNVYPSYFNSVSLYARNNGSIPMIVDTVWINGVKIRKSPSPVVKLDCNGDGQSDVEIWWGNGFGTQIDPGDRSPQMSFWFHVLQEAPQGAQLDFSIAIEAIQWNKYVAP